jgi:hypothetical protein
MAPNLVAFLVGIGIVVFGAGVWAVKPPAPTEQNKISFLGFEVTLSTPAIAIMAIGIVLVLASTMLPGNTPDIPHPLTPAPQQRVLASNLTPMQLHIVQLIDQGHFDQALAELDSLEKELDQTSTGSAGDQIQLGYAYKTFAQAFERRGNLDQGNRYAGLALNLFELVRGDKSASTEQRARAIHGIGNIEHFRGDYRSAIADYRLAITIDPHTPYAWYDTFLAYEKLAQRGEVDLAAMQEALEKTKDLDVLTLGEKAGLDKLVARYNH